MLTERLYKFPWVASDEEYRPRVQISNAEGVPLFEVLSQTGATFEETKELARIIIAAVNKCQP